MTTPIELGPNARAPRPPGAARRVAGQLVVALALAIVLAVFVQVYLIGAYIFGAGPVALDAHRSVGFTAHGFEMLILIAALVAPLPSRDRVLSFLLAAIGTVQIALAGGHSWVGGLHPLLALVVLGLAGVLLRSGIARHRARRGEQRAVA